MTAETQGRGIPDHVARSIERHLIAIGDHFKPGAKITLLVRNDLGDGKDADAVFTIDELPLAIEALQRRATALAKAKAGA